jgi:CDP-glucose 4,6-dehydratase
MVHSYSILKDFYNQRKVLITGHTGFKGSWLSMWFALLGAKVTGYALEPETKPNLFSIARVKDLLAHHEIADLRDQGTLSRVLEATAPEIVFHMAAQPLVRRSYNMPIETFSVNALGTAILLESIRSVQSVRVVVIITTDKVYENQEWVYPYRETDRLGGRDPYSTSKACAELITTCYRRSFFSSASSHAPRVASARAGNVVGGGDWSEDRLFPDIVRAWQSSQPMVVRHPNAVRPWQHVLEPLAGYLQLSAKLWDDPTLAGAWNFGPNLHEIATVREVTKLARGAYEKGEVLWGDENQGPHEANWLALDNSKTRHRIGVAPLWDLKETVRRTMSWYRQLSEGQDARSLCEADIKDYSELL